MTAKTPMRFGSIVTFYPTASSAPAATLDHAKRVLLSNSTRPINAPAFRTILYERFIRMRHSMQALVIIDIQNDYFPGGKMELVGSNAAAENAALLLAAFRKAQRPIFHVQHISLAPTATFFLPDTPGMQIHPLVCPQEDETVVQKHFPNSFRETPLLDLLKVRGMSMRDAGILDGDLLAVHRSSEARNGQIVVARLDDDVTVKRFRQHGAIVELVAENPDFAPIVIDTRERTVEIEGIAVGLIRGGEAM